MKRSKLIALTVSTLLLLLLAFSCSNDDNEIGSTPSVKSDEKKITSFKFLASENNGLLADVNAEISDSNFLLPKTVSVSLPFGTNITALKPTIEISPKAVLSPVADTRNFATPVTYTVTAENGTTATYTVTVTLEQTEDPQRIALLSIATANPGNTLGWVSTEPDLNKWNGVTTDANGNVTTLHIQGRGIQVLPAQIGDLKKLTELKLDDNSLTSLPKEIGSLPFLKTLHVARNDLQSLPIEIGQLTALNELWLVDNGLTSVPAEIGHLSNLKRLNLADNDLSSIPTEMGQLISLETLYLGENNLLTVSSELGHLTNLIDLTLYANKLTALPAEFAQLTKLKSLDLSQNEFTGIPETIFQLTSLTELELWENKITTIPQNIQQLMNLEDLALSNNLIVSIPIELGLLTNLRELKLDRNKITSVPAEIGQLINLDLLWLENNDYIFMPQGVCDLPVKYGTIVVKDPSICQN